MPSHNCAVRVRLLVTLFKQVFGCTSTLLVDALGHAGLYSIPNCSGCFPYNKTAQGLVTGYETALSAGDVQSC